MEAKTFRQWIGRIYATEPVEIDCDEAQMRLPAYVDNEVQGGELDTAVDTHLHQCPDCLETYEGLRYVARLEQQGTLAETDGKTEEVTAVAGS